MSIMMVVDTRGRGACSGAIWCVHLNTPQHKGYTSVHAHLSVYDVCKLS